RFWPVWQNWDASSALVTRRGDFKNPLGRGQGQAPREAQEQGEMMAASYTLVVGTRNWSSWSLRPYMALMATGAPFETVAIALRRPETKAEILRHSPSGKVPLLR